MSRTVSWRGLWLRAANSLLRLDQQGNAKPITDFTASFFAPRFSPDGKRIAYQTLGNEMRWWIYDLDRGTPSPLTSEGFPGFCAWTPDGKVLVFGWCKSGVENLHWQPADLSLPMSRLTTGESGQYPGSFTPDGSTLAFAEEHPGSDCNILLLDMKSHRVKPFLNSKADEGWPEISPDGRWIAYASDESGRLEVWVRPFPGPVGRWRVSKEGGWQPIWSKDGRQLFYRWGDKVRVSDIRVDEGFAAGKPRLLFQQQGFQSGRPIRNWDIWPDGQGFLMVKFGERMPQPVTKMILVQNWFEELKRLVPTGKK